VSSVDALRDAKLQPSPVSAYSHISSLSSDSGMLQSWNKFCFVGGIVEFSAKLPGDSGTAGLWPASK